jgi:lipopolysaccharide/colanic/teichoic acid biosynthesis glycosyltransferase
MKASMKRLFDVAVAATGLALLAVPFAVIALAIKVSSPGTVFYRQKRIGRGGQPFWLYKFRSMRNAEGGAQVTVDGDQRITAVGRVLRRWKLDELPQLYNVLRGEMSLVGPRPEVERFVRRYTAEQRLLLEQTPGLAGLAQLVYPHEADLLRGCDDPEEAYERYLLPRKLAVELQYEQQRTFWSDMRLLGELGLLVLGKSYRTDRDFRMPPYAETRTD